MHYFILQTLQAAPFAVLGGILFFLIRRHRQRKRGLVRSPVREVVLALFVCYLIGLWALTLEPNNLIGDFWYRVRYHMPPREGGWFYFRPVLDVRRWSFSFRLDNLLESREALFNLALFLPFGLLFPLLWPRRAWLTPLRGFALSLMIELLQMPLQRSADARDVVMNTVGTLIGLLGYSLLCLIAPGFTQAAARKSSRPDKQPE